MLNDEHEVPEACYGTSYIADISLTSDLLLLKLHNLCDELWVRIPSSNLRRPQSQFLQEGV